MADPQLKRGHIRIANHLFRAAMLAKLSPVESRALMECLWRQYGWSHGGPPVPFKVGGSGLAQSIGGTRSTASQAITSLVDAGIIGPTGESDDRGRRFFLVQKDFERWTCGFHRNPSRVHWTPVAGEVSPLRNASVLISEHKRPDIETLDTSNDQPVAVSSEPLEPKRTKENQICADLAPQKIEDWRPVWEAWRESNPTARKSPTSGQRATIKARLRDYSVEDLSSYFRWLRESPHKRALFCRSEGHDGWTSVMRPTNVDERMPWVSEWTGGGSVQAPQAERKGESYPRWLEEAVMQKIPREGLSREDLTIALLQAHPRIGEVSESMQREVLDLCLMQMGWSR